jgi:glycosyltransferase involved in cell wall biosynthesis
VTATSPLVSICCLTYNHEKYLRTAIESFLMQETSFPIEIVIHDDASTDGTAEIVAAYQSQRPDLFVSIRQPANLYSQGVRGITVRYLLPRARGRYVALCEGDDYWTDPRKLQKQVDFLEANSQFSGAFHETQQLMFDGTPGRIFAQKAPSVMFAEDTFTTLSPFHTSSLVFRQTGVPYPDWLSEVVSGDMAIFSILTAYGPLQKLPGVMSVYRKHPEGITSMASVMDQFHQRRIELMRRLNEFHGFKFDAYAQKVIRAHEREIAKTHDS